MTAPKLTDAQWAAVYAALMWIDAAGDYSEFAESSPRDMQTMRRAMHKIGAALRGGK